MKHKLNAKQKEVLENIIKVSPEKFGVRAIYFRTSDDGLELLFLVEKKSKASVISYLNSVSDTYGEAKGVPITSSVYFVGSPTAKDIIEDQDFQKEAVVKRIPAFA